MLFFSRNPFVAVDFLCSEELLFTTRSSLLLSSLSPASLVSDSSCRRVSRKRRHLDLRRTLDDHFTRDAEFLLHICILGTSDSESLFASSFNCTVAGPEEQDERRSRQTFRSRNMLLFPLPALKHLIPRLIFLKRPRLPSSTHKLCSWRFGHKYLVSSLTENVDQVPLKFCRQELFAHLF